MITWDEGSGSSNHIPTVVVTPTAQGVEVTEPVTHCGLLGMEQRLLGLPLLGCAAGAPTPTRALGLACREPSGLRRTVRRVVTGGTVEA